MFFFNRKKVETNVELVPYSGFSAIAGQSHGIRQQVISFRNALFSAKRLEKVLGIATSPIGDIDDKYAAIDILLDSKELDKEQKKILRLGYRELRIFDRALQARG